MNIILLDHIEELGSVGQTVKVKDGYARNYLLPRKLACLATEKNLNFYKGLIEAKQKKLAKAKGRGGNPGPAAFVRDTDFRQKIQGSGR